MDSIVQEVMSAFGLSKKADLAVMLGVTPSAINRYEERGLSGLAWRKIQREARERGLKLPESFYAAESPKKGEAA